MERPALVWISQHPHIISEFVCLKLKGAIVTVLGPDAINYSKVTKFLEEECVLGVALTQPD